MIKSLLCYPGHKLRIIISTVWQGGQDFKVISYNINLFNLPTLWLINDEL